MAKIQVPKEPTAPPFLIQSIKYRELTPEEVEQLKIKVWGLKEYLRRSAIVHGDVGQRWVEQASATAELHGFRLF